MLESEEVVGTTTDPVTTNSLSKNMVVNNNCDGGDDGVKCTSTVMENGSAETEINFLANSPEPSSCKDGPTVNGFQTNNNNNSNGTSGSNSSSSSSSSGGTWTPQPFAPPFIPHIHNSNFVSKAPNGSMGQSPKRSSNRFSPGPRDSRGGSPGNATSIPTTTPPCDPNSPTVCGGGGVGGQHVVLLHVNHGETISIQMGPELQLIQGPATVRMVSNNTTPPIPMPVQVPPGHMVQQIVDENGTLRHVILSAQPHIPVPMGRPTYAPGPPPPPPNAPSSPTYYSYHPPYTTQFHPRHPLGIPPAHLSPHSLHQHPGPPPPTAPHNHPCNNHQRQGPSPPPLHPTHMDDRTQRQYQKIKRKFESRQRETNHVTNSRFSPPNSPMKENSNKKYKDRNTSTSGLDVDDHLIQEEEADLIKLLSSMCVPQVSQVTSTSALIKWQPPKSWVEKNGDGEKIGGDFDIKESEFNYELLLSDKGREGKYKVVCCIDKLEYWLTELKPASEYYVCVIALWDTLRGQMSESALLRTLSCEPSTPTSLKMTNRNKSSITLRWNAAADNGSKLLYYILEYDEANKEGEQFKEVFRGLQKQFNVTKLAASTCYRFRIAAANEIGRSEFSAPYSSSTSGGAPSQPCPPQLTEAHVNSLKLSWERWPSDDSSILQMEDPATGHGFLTSYNGPECNYTVTGLKRCHEYKFRLCVKNEEGSSPWSETCTFCTRPDRPSVPSRPISKGRIHSHSFKVVWDPPRNNGGADIICYNLEMDSDSGFTNIYQGQETEFICDRLNPGHTYHLRVNCDGPGGQSEYSDVGTFVTAAVVPGQCASPRLYGKPKAISIHLKWNPPAENGGSPITEYAIEVASSDGMSREAYKGRETDCVVAGLFPGRTYMFRVCAFNAIGRGLWSENLEAVCSPASPEPPAELTVQARSPHSIVASWKEPFSNGAPITEYRLECSHKENEFSLVYSGSACSCEVSKGLFPATLFSFRVQAVNVAGVGQFCEPVQIMTLSSSPSSISSASVRASCTPYSIHLTWHPPDCHGSEITAYNIDLGEKHGHYTVEGSCQHLLEGLQPETTYRIRIQAVNSVGVGPFSSVVKVTTKALPPPAPRLECMGTSHNSLKLKWGDGKNTDFIRYTLEMGTRSGNFSPIYSGTAMTYKVPKLNETTDYHFRIFGSNDAGAGSYSVVHVFTTTKAPPSPPKAPSVSKITETSCFVEWNPLKQMGDDRLSYQLQLLGGSKDQDYRVIYRGEDNCFNLTGLEPRTEYSIRVGGVREFNKETSGGENNCLMGSVGPSFTFLTSGPELNAVNCEGKASSLATTRVCPRKPLSDQQWAFVFLFGFVIFGFVVAAVIQHAIAVTTEV